MSLFEELAIKISAISAVARTGLAWSENLYEKERYERILELAAEIAGLLSHDEEELDRTMAQALKAGWLAQVTPGVSGYVTPKISTAALCFNSEGHLLLGQRGESGLWFVPTGWQEVGLTPAENVVKEVLEETGITCRALRVLGVHDTRSLRRNIPGAENLASSSLHSIAITFLCEAVTYKIVPHPLETREAGFYDEDTAVKLVPERVVPLIRQGFAAWRGEYSSVHFD
jgi:8-oxo-dGTP pyrophosphatase MutT (NUDIX family)